MSPQFSSKSPTIRRILREAAELSNGPSPDYAAEPLESDLFEWHFTLRGPPNSVYGDGLYHGRIVLPPTYPLRPPSFRFTTPNGRFEANREICLSISGHHEETWQPAWGIRTAIVALRSFMETDTRGQLGGLETTEAVRRRLAADSPAFKCSTCGRTNADIIGESETRAKELSAEGHDVEVPQELNMGWRDELDAKQPPAQPASDSPSTSKEESESAPLAEGFVQTADDQPPPDQRAPAPSSRSAAPNGGPESAGRAAPVPARRNHPPQRPHLAAGELRQARQDGVPIWIDRAIVALVILLSALVLKVLIGV